MKGCADSASPGLTKSATGICCTPKIIFKLTVVDTSGWATPADKSMLVSVLKIFFSSERHPLSIRSPSNACHAWTTSPAETMPEAQGTLASYCLGTPCACSLTTSNKHQPQGNLPSLEQPKQMTAIIRSKTPEPVAYRELLSVLDPPPLTPCPSLLHHPTLCICCSAAAAAVAFAAVAAAAESAAAAMALHTCWCSGHACRWHSRPQ